MLKAVEQGDIELVQYHLDNGIDVNYEHPEIITTVLIESVKSGNVEMTRFLIERGADPYKKAGFGNLNAIQTALQLEGKEMVSMLDGMNLRVESKSIWSILRRFIFNN